MLQRDSELYVIDRAQIGEEKARIEKAINDVKQSMIIDTKHIEGNVVQIAELCCAIDWLLKGTFASCLVSVR